MLSKLCEVYLYLFLFQLMEVLFEVVLICLEEAKFADLMFPPNEEYLCNRVPRKTLVGGLRSSSFTHALKTPYILVHEANS